MDWYAFFYGFFNFLAFWAMLASNLMFRKESAKLISGPARIARRFCPQGKKEKKKAEKIMALFTLVEISALTAIQFFPGIPYGVWTGNLFGTGKNYVGTAVLSPITFIVVCLLLKEEPFGHLDLFAPGYAIALAFFKIACYMFGCCGGMHINVRFPYPGRFLYQFPIQLLEMALALGIFVFLLKKRKTLCPGTVQPLYLILYSVTRFCSEFFRCEENIIGPLKRYHIVLLFGALIGLAEYVVMKKYGAAVIQWTQEWCSKPYRKPWRKRRKEQRVDP